MLRRVHETDPASLIVAKMDDWDRAADEFKFLNHSQPFKLVCGDAVRVPLDEIQGITINLSFISDNATRTPSCDHFASTFLSVASEKSRMRKLSLSRGS